MKGTKLYQERYTLLGKIAPGGFATVYRASEEGRQEEIAIKLGIVSDDPGYARSLRAEARMLQQFEHANIVKLYPIRRYDKQGEVWYANALGIAGEPVFFVMEYLQGGSLEKYLQQVKRLSVQETAVIALHMARALDYIHQHGVAHNDLKLENIVFREPVIAGRPFTPVLVDFGIATRIQSPNAGSLYIMPPEKVDELKLEAAPEVTADVDHSMVDVWGLGVVMYRMLGGQLPFSGRNERSLTQRIRHSRPVSLRHLANDIPNEIDELIIDGCLAKDPQYRLTLLEIGRWLNSLVSGQEIVAQHSSETTNSPRIWGWFGRKNG